jgi:hypothetical protein
MFEIPANHENCKTAWAVTHGGDFVRLKPGHRPIELQRAAEGGCPFMQPMTPGIHSDAPNGLLGLGD